MKCIRAYKREPLLEQSFGEDEDHETGLQVRLDEALADERRAEERDKRDARRAAQDAGEIEERVRHLREYT